MMSGGGGARLISSELNSYQSEKKIGGPSGHNDHHYNSGNRGAGGLN